MTDLNAEPEGDPWRFVAKDGDPDWAALAVQESRVEEARQMMSTLINAQLGITREEFLSNLDAGMYHGTEDIGLLHLITMAPFAR